MFPTVYRSPLSDLVATEQYSRSSFSIMFSVLLVMLAQVLGELGTNNDSNVVIRRKLRAHVDASLSNRKLCSCSQFAGSSSG